ncbi:hypothetical protein HHI36_011708 [Cryptolaemus montrouzieri]|uniref:Uncharacterized protein n=1 Tax=Cryptolaemus montrouzieri TaxID=559131 RepID=A0ABD2MMV8_9CUCU
MGIGGDGVVKKAKAGGDYIKKKSKTGNKRSKGNKQKRKKSKKSAGKRSEPDKISKSSRRSSADSVEETTEDDNTKNEDRPDEADTATLVKPEKIDETCVTAWSEPTTFCCVDLANKSTITPYPCGDTKCRNVCLNLVREEMGKDMADRQEQARLCIERLSNERDYYRAEFERLLKFFEKLGSPDLNEEGNELSCIACQKKQQMVEYLQRENQVLAKEKLCLMSRLEEGGARFDMESPLGKCCKPSCKRLERERDLLKLDTERLEEEIDCMLEKMKTLSENKTREYAKFQEQRIEYESAINKLENERRELIKAQGIRRATINALEEKVDMYTNLVRVAQDELHRMKTQYCQLKKLHEQCDKALLDTQAQLVQVETELLSCQKRKDPATIKKYGKEIQVFPPKCQCIDVATEPERNISFASEDIKTKMQQLDKDKDELLNVLDLKTEKLHQCEIDGREKDDKIIKLQEEIIVLKSEMSGIESELILLKENCKKSEVIIEEKTMEIKNLQTEATDKIMEMKKIQTVIEKKESQNRALQAEVEHLNKESFALATSNHQLQTDTHQSKVQVSVAMETVNELENKTKQLEETVTEYEHQIQMMKNDLEDCRIQIRRKETEIDQLLKNKHNLKNLSEQLDAENRAGEKTIYELKCECQKLRIDLMGLGSKEKMILDLNAQLSVVKAERDALEKENGSIRKKVSKLEDKLFQCVCSICDRVQDRCTLLNCLFGDLPSSVGTQRSKMEGKDVALQTYVDEGGAKHTKTSTNSIKQVMAAIPLNEEKSSRVITSLSTLPGSSEQSSNCKKDTIIASMYHSLSPNAPFSCSPEPHRDINVEDENRKKTPLNVIIEEASTSLIDDELYSPESSSWNMCANIGMVEEKQKYIIDNVTSVCKVIQVDTEETFIRRKRFGRTSEESKTPT